MTICYYVGAEQPRMMRDRHEEGCSNAACKGCSPCVWLHCRRCSVQHAEHTCPACLADARADLAEILRLCANLPAEAIVKGVESEAMNLLGPAADPEALGHMRASVSVGRIPPDWLDAADDDRHPLLVLGGWAEAYVEAFGHVEPARITVASAASYLDRNLAYCGAEPDVPFEDFARDLATCRRHLEQVLHDGEQVETGAPCLGCDRPLMRVWRDDPLPWLHRDGSRPRAEDDGWACSRCRDWRTEVDYRRNVAEEHQRKADWLTGSDMIERTKVTRGSLTAWASKGRVAKRASGGRVVYRVRDVLDCLGTTDDTGDVA